VRELARFRLAQIDCQPGGWAAEIAPTPEEIKMAESRWAKRSYRPDVEDENGWIANQCGGCRFFAASGADFGICWNERSPLDGCVVFEHGGCKEHSAFGEGEEVNDTSE
jgi:hypothetical protein